MAKKMAPKSKTKAPMKKGGSKNLKSPAERMASAKRYA